jgi:hypothetical protein
MARKIIVLEDDSFMEEENVDGYEVLREIRNASWPRDHELHGGEPDAAEDLLLTSYGVTGEDEIWCNWIRIRKPRAN